METTTLINLQLKSWSALSPGLNDVESWRSWFANDPLPVTAPIDPPKLKQVAPLLRRRFTAMGKYAAQAALNVSENADYAATIYASRHGDTPLSLALLKEIADHQPLSPTSFSLAVHNAVGGLLSIAWQDTSPITAIAGSNLVVSTLHEAAAQLTCYQQVLCVIYDVPLPDLYQSFCQSLPFPVAVAFVLTQHDEGAGLQLSLSDEPGTAQPSEDPVFALIALLSGIRDEVSLKSGDQCWRLTGAGR